MNAITTKPPENSRRSTIAWTLLIIGLCLYAPFRSISLDDFDAYSFALALERFDLALQQPQPPGFPIYVGLARCLYSLTADPLAALTWVSALSGVAALLLIYKIGRQLDPVRPFTGVAAALWLGLTPLAWLTTEKALSDAAGLAGILLPLWLWTRWQRSGRGLAFAALTSGLALGIRPQNALPLALYIAYALLAHSLDDRQRNARRPWFLTGALGLCGVLLWLIPTAWAAGGLDAYVAQIHAHAAHVGQADSLWSLSVPLPTALRYRLLAFGDTLLTSLVGVELFTPLSLGDGMRLGALTLVVGVGVARVDWRRRATWGLLLWALLMAGQILLYVTLDRPRLMLPLLPPLALLMASGWARIRRPHWLPSLLMAITCLALLIQGAPLAATIATVPAPPTQATAYVGANYPPETTLIAAAGSFRAVQVELPNYRLAYLYRFEPETVRAALAERRYVVIFDRDKFPPEAMAALSDDGRWVTLEEKTFVRDQRVHTQHDQVRVQVLTLASQVPTSALHLPDDGCIDLGGGADGRYLGAGWFRPEDVGGAQGRWAGGTLTSTVRVALPEARAYRLRGRALAFPPEQSMLLEINGRRIETRALPQAWIEFEMQIPAAALLSISSQEEQTTTLALIHSAAQSAFDATDGGSSDQRALTAAYDWLCIEALPDTHSFLLPGDR